ncbi:hypothetical protein Tco_0438936 [Tanacetum coccineum]
MPNCHFDYTVSFQSCHVAASDWPAANNVAATSSATWLINTGQWSVDGGQPSVNGWPTVVNRWSMAGQRWSTAGQMRSRRSTAVNGPPHRTSARPKVNHPPDVADHHRTIGQWWSKTGFVTSGQGMGRVSLLLVEYLISLQPRTDEPATSYLPNLQPHTYTVSCQSCHVAASDWPAANDVAATSSATWLINAGQWSVDGGQPSVNGGQWWSTTGQRPTTIGLSPDHRLTSCRVLAVS